MASSPERNPPAHYMPAGMWPDGPLAPDAPNEAYLAASLAIRLRKHMRGRTLDTMAELTGLGRQTIDNILIGKSWPELRTIARLESRAEATTVGEGAPKRSRPGEAETALSHRPAPVEALRP